MVAHPRNTLDEHTTSLDRLLERLGRYKPQSLQKLVAPAPNRANFMNVVFALELIGTDARAAAPDLARLWESNGNFFYSTYNGFPLALSELGDSSPKILAALHRHFASPDRLHRALSAFAAWKLNPEDTEAIQILRRELTTSDNFFHARYALADTFSRWGGTDAVMFLTEIRALVASAPNNDYERLAHEAAARILNSKETER